jgi:hypothetical protein
VPGHSFPGFLGKAHQDRGRRLRIEVRRHLPQESVIGILEQRGGIADLQYLDHADGQGHRQGLQHVGRLFFGHAFENMGGRIQIIVEKLLHHRHQVGVVRHGFSPLLFFFPLP